MNVSMLWNLVEDVTTLSAEGRWELIRRYRNEELSRTDWTQIADAPLEIEEKQAWAAYRQELRDIPQNFLLWAEVVLPTRPGQP